MSYYWVPHEPQHAARDEQEKGQNRELRATHPAQRSVAVIPGERRHERGAEKETNCDDARYNMRPVEGCPDHFDNVQQRVGGRRVGEQPLHNLMLANASPVSQRRHGRQGCDRSRLSLVVGGPRASAGSVVIGALTWTSLDAAKHYRSAHDVRRSAYASPTPLGAIDHQYFGGGSAPRPKSRPRLRAELRSAPTSSPARHPHLASPESDRRRWVWGYFGGVGLLWRRGATLAAWGYLLAARGYLLAARGYLLAAWGYLLAARRYLLAARRYLLAGCFRACSRASRDGTRRGSSRHRLCRPASAPANPGGCPAYHPGDPPRTSA